MEEGGRYIHQETSAHHTETDREGGTRAED